MLLWTEPRGQIEVHGELISEVTCFGRNIHIDNRRNIGEEVMCKIDVLGSHSANFKKDISQPVIWLSDMFSRQVLRAGHGKDLSVRVLTQLQRVIDPPLVMSMLLLVINKICGILTILAAVSAPS